MRALPALGLLALLAACGDGQPFEFGTPSEPTDPEAPSDNGVPEEVGRNLESADFTPPAGGEPGSLVVEITSLDSTPVEVEYLRNPALDVPGYIAYSVQEDPLDRIFIGMADASADGALEGVLVADGGQFNRYFSGVYFERTSGYSPHDPEQPENGLVSYAGDYVGMLNGGEPLPNEALPLPPGTDPAVAPNQAIRVTGEIFINADFTDNTVNGAIYDREAVDVPQFQMEDLALTSTEIAEDGTFLLVGGVETCVGCVVGDYAGIFGGTGATSVAGGIYLTGDFIPNVDNENETGVFVLDQCGAPGDDPICDGVNPN